MQIIRRFDRIAIFLMVACWGAHALAADYTVTNAASCEAFGDAIGSEASWGFSKFCMVSGGTLPASDSVTFSGIAGFRPQTEAFTNQGTITIDSSDTGFYGAAQLNNQGSFNIISADGPQNYSSIVNDGGFTTDAALFNGGSIVSSCRATFEGTILGTPPVLEECDVVVSSTTATTAETGTTDTFSYVLVGEPAADVVVTVSVGDPSEGLLSDADETAEESVTLTFTPANSDTPQSVTIIGQDDALADDHQTYDVTATTSSTEDDWQGLPVENVVVTNTDDDAAGVDVSPVTGLSTTEAGDTANFDVVLSAQPEADVSIDFETSDASEGLVSSSATSQQSVVTLTFTSTNWGTAQQVTIHGQDDAVTDGDQGYEVNSAPVSSSDSNWNGLAVDNVPVTNLDDDVSSVTVTPTSGLVTGEDGANDTFTLALTSEPTADVSIDIVSSDTSEGTVSPTSATFTSADWDVPQTMTASGVNDDLADGDQAYVVVTGDVVSTDPTYNGLEVSDVSATNLDDDTSANDSDGDGIDDVIEDNGPNGGDGNGDGTPDSTQPGVTSLPGVSEDGYVTVVSTCQLRDVRAVAAQSVDPTPLALSHGLVEFRLPCTSSEMSVLYHGEETWADDIGFWKFGPVTPGEPETSRWYQLPGAMFDAVDVFGVTVARTRFTLDDGELGDDTFADGQILAVGGPGRGSPVLAVPTLSQWTLLLLAVLLMVTAFSRKARTALVGSAGVRSP